MQGSGSGLDLESADTLDPDPEEYENEFLRIWWFYLYIKNSWIRNRIEIFSWIRIELIRI